MKSRPDPGSQCWRLQPAASRPTTSSWQARTSVLVPVFREIGVEILAPVPPPTRRQLDAPWADTTRAPAVQGASSDTQIPSCFRDRQQLFPFSILPGVTHRWPIMTNILFTRGRSSKNVLA